MKKTHSLLLFLLLCFTSYGQNYQWSKLINGHAFAIEKTFIDSQKNLYLTGTFGSIIDFDPGPGIASLTPVYSSVNHGDAFFAKYDSSGIFIWVKTIKSSNKELINDIVVDASGNIYLTGTFWGIVDFGGVSLGTGDIYYSDMFFAKYNSSGNCIWANKIGANFNDNEEGTAIDVDALGNVYVAGRISNPATDLDFGAGVSPSTFFSSNISIFAKYSSSGAYIWGTNYNIIAIDDIAVSGSDVYFAGEYFGTVDFDPSVSSVFMTSTGSASSTFFSKYNLAGTYQWVKSIDVGQVYKIFVDGAGNLLIAGNLWGGADFDPGPGVGLEFGLVQNNLFFAKYTTSGTYVWAKVISGLEYLEAHFAFDINGNTYLTSLGYPGYDVDPGPGVVEMEECNEYINSIYFGKYSTAGNYLWGNLISGNINYSVSDIAVSSSQSIYLTGGLLDSADVYPGPGRYNIYSGPMGGSLFVSKYTAQTSSVVVPGQPTSISVSAPDAFHLSVNFIDNATNETGFFVERSVSGGSWEVRDTLNANVVTMLDSVNPYLVNRYVYRVKAFNTNSYSCYSDTLGYTLNEMPVAPSGLTGDNTIPGQIILNWTDNSTTETFFRIDRWNSASGFDDSVSANVVTYTDTTNFVTGDTYFYQIRAFSAFGMSSSNVISTVANGIPAIPTLLTVTSPVAYATALYFSNVSNNEDGFIIERKPLTGAWTVVDSIPGTVGYYYSYPDAGLTAGVYYTYRLSAYNSYGSSAYSDTAGALVSTINAPGYMLALNYYAPYQIYVFWDDLSNNEDGFVIERKSQATGLWNVQDSVGMDETSYFDSIGLVVGNLYTYRVYAYNSSDRSSYSDTMQTFVESSILAPSNLVLGADYIDSSITLYWLDNSLLESGYIIQRKTAPGSWMSIDTIPANSNTYTDNGLQLGVTYSYRVYGYDATDLSSYSNIDSLMANFGPTGITLADGLDGSIIINWTDNSVMENGFEIQVSSDNGLNWGVVTAVGANEISTVHNPLYTNDVYYLYRIKAVDLTGVNGAFSDTAGISYSFPYLTAVWPGDANHDSVVNSSDLLPIGLYYSQTGIPRDYPDILWQPHGCWDWDSAQVNGSDLKHIDSDGNGMIDSFDTVAIATNFTLTHAIVQSNFNDERLVAPDIYFVPLSSSYNSGDSVTVEVWLGSALFPVTNLYGISFTINYDGSLVVPGTEKVVFTNSWLALPGLNAIDISKADGLANSCYSAITRVDHANSSGYGKIGYYTFRLKNTITSNINMVFSVSDYEANTASGSPVAFNNTLIDSVSITPLILGINNVNVAEEVSVYPNPFTTQTILVFNKEIKNASVKIFDALGNEIRSMRFSGKEMVIQKDEMKAGMYFIQIAFSGGGMLTKKVVIREL